MTKIEKRKAVLRIIREIVANSAEYDADTVHVDLAGQVTAKKDPDKVPSLPREAFLGRYLIGDADHMIKQLHESR